MPPPPLNAAMAYSIAQCQDMIDLYREAIAARLGRGAVQKSSKPGASLIEHYGLEELEAGLATWERRLLRASNVGSTGSSLSFAKTINGGVDL